MLKLSGGQLWTCCTYLASTVQHMRLHRTEAYKVSDRRAVMDEEMFDQTAAAVAMIGGTATDLKMISPRAASDRALTALQAVADRWPLLSAQDLSSLISPLEQLLQSFTDELQARTLLVMLPDRIGLLEPQAPLFGTEVESRFPGMSEDIAEAARCLALSRPTASVFHLMRVMELANRELGGALGVTLADQKNWQVILDEANKAIRGLNQKDHKTKQFSEAAAHLYNVKLAWRNETMHPKQTYTEDEAEAIFSATKIFARDLAFLI